MKKSAGLFMVLSLYLLVACSTSKYFPPVATSWATKPNENISTETPMTTEKSNPTITITPLLTWTSTQKYLSTMTPKILPVTDKIWNFFSHGIPNDGQLRNVELKMIDVVYEERTASTLNLRISIQCFPGQSICSLTIARDVFIDFFLDPEPQPEKMNMFPSGLEEFQVIGFDENMNLVENVTGRWSNLIELENGSILLDEFLKKLVYH
jgi:hypothetical protein